jgi:tetratricopeptide (TPR) repeat protein
MDITLRHAALTIALLGVVIGCASNEQPATTREEAAQALTRGNEAFNRKDYAAASTDLTIALSAGGLAPDDYATAMVKRAVCWGAEGKYEEALAELTKLEASAPNLDQILAARAFVLKKQGKVAEANAAMAKARQYNRTIKEFM